MKDIFKIGDKRTYLRTVTSVDLARFHGEVVHPVYATFALARDIEWTTRQFVIDGRDDDEEGIGTFIEINHHAPAFEAEEITFNGYIEEINGHELICRIEAFVGTRLIATGRTGQKILKREKIKMLFQRA